MLYRVTLHLSLDELRALKALADDELRACRDQARCVLQEELGRRGYLKLQEAGTAGTAKLPKAPDHAGPAI
jgi:hypothetical protein